MVVLVGIIGAGIGGLSAALSLRDAGFDVQVYEQAPKSGEIGAGVQVSPNASCILRSPLADRSRPGSAFPTTTCTALTCSNCWPPRSSPNGYISGTGWSAWSTSRTGWWPSSARRAVRSRQAALHRMCRLPRAGSGRSAARPGLGGVRAGVAGPGRHFVHYFVSGRRLVNFVGVVEQDTWTRESWTDRGDLADALAAYDGWHPHVRAILHAADETFVWALFDPMPMDRWSAMRCAATSSCASRERRACRRCPVSPAGRASAAARPGR